MAMVYQPRLRSAPSSDPCWFSSEWSAEFWRAFIGYGGDGLMTRKLNLKNGIPRVAFKTASKVTVETITGRMTRDLPETVTINEFIKRMMYTMFTLDHGPNYELYHLRAA